MSRGSPRPPSPSPGPDRPIHPGSGRPTVAVVDLDACVRNLDRIRARIGPRGVWAVVKADAYGHGAVPVARALAAGGATGFGVATAAEGVELRRAGIAQPILVMGGIEPTGKGTAAGIAEVDPAELVVDHGLRPAVWDGATARELAAAAAARDAGPVPVHLKVDTGMGRLGVLPDEAVDLAVRLRELDGVRLDGLFASLSSADELDDAGREHTRTQIRRFEEICRALADAGCLPPRRHLANSAGLLHHPESWDADWCTDVRPGLALYGVSQTPGRDPEEMEPVLELRTEVAAVRRLPAGWPIGYGRTSIPEADRRVAVLPLGYHDGWPRALGNRGEAIVRGRRVPVLGAVSMDLTVVDVDDLGDVEVGEPAFLIGAWPRQASDERPPVGSREGSPDDGGGVRITAEEVAERAGTIAHELLCRIGGRVPRRYVGGDPREDPDRGA